jgi:Domain of unknown function (DUF4936)
MNGQVVYVYYKVPVDQHAVWAPLVRGFQAQLVAAWPGLVVELLQRPEATDGKETWMETYRHAQGLGEDLRQAIQQAAISAGLPAPRHTEQFMPLS